MMHDSARSMSKPRWDGSRLTFEIRDGQNSVECAISRSALLDISGKSHLRPAELMDCFMQARPRIEAVAWAKFHQRPEGATNLLNIWSDDLEPEDEAGEGAVNGQATRA